MQYAIAQLDHDAPGGPPILAKEGKFVARLVATYLDDDPKGERSETLNEIEVEWAPSTEPGAIGAMVKDAVVARGKLLKRENPQHPGDASKSIIRYNLDPANVTVPTLGN